MRHGRGVGALNSAADMTFLDCTNSGHALRVAGIGRAVSGVATAGPGLHGFSNTDNGVVGLAVANALNGVQGQAHNPGASGVYGQPDNNGYGVAGRSRNIGVFGESTGNGLGVYGASSDGPAVQGASINGSGVRGVSANSVGVVATTNSATAAGGNAAGIWRFSSCASMPRSGVLACPPAPFPRGQAAD